MLSISKFQEDLLNQKFLLRIDCKSAKDILQKDVQNIASKQIFARWQAILSVFDFDIEFINGSSNSLPDFLTREFLQGQCLQNLPINLPGETRAKILPNSHQKRNLPASPT